jgi:hypothetical protein
MTFLESLVRKKYFQYKDLFSHCLIVAMMPLVSTITAPKSTPESRISGVVRRVSSMSVTDVSSAESSVAASISGVAVSVAGRDEGVASVPSGAGGRSSVAALVVQVVGVVVVVVVHIVVMDQLLFVVHLIDQVW